jgi:uncharacterized membrane protein YhaH (DUF805 family)
MGFCTNCGTKLDDGAKFCVNCGAKVEGVAETAAPGQPDQTANNYAVPPYAANNTVFASAQNKNAWQYFCDVWKKYAVFSGRARRAEYWWFLLFNAIISIGLSLIDYMADTNITDSTGLLGILYSLAVFLPSWGVMVRRFHDVDRRAWWCLGPSYGWIRLPCTAGTVGPNRFGPDPKQVS